MGDDKKTITIDLAEYERQQAQTQGGQVRRPERDLLGAGALPLMRGVTFTHGAWAVRALADACILTALAGHDVVSVVKRGIYFWLALPLLTVFVMFVLVFGALFIWAREDWRARRNM